MLHRQTARLESKKNCFKSAIFYVFSTVGFIVTHSVVVAQTNVPMSVPTATATSASTALPAVASASSTIEARPVWSSLTAAEQAALKPMQADWASLDATRKKKWLAVAKRYAEIQPAEQARMHERMQAWSKLSPAQRAQARDNYSSVLSSPSSKPEAGSNQANLNTQYEKYLALPPEKRAELKAKAEQAEADKAVQSKLKSKPLQP